MSIDVCSEVKIQRSPEDVATFMFNPKNDAIWTTGVVECRPLSDGNLHLGAKVERVSKFLGRRFGYLVEVIGYEEGQAVDMLVKQPFEMRIRYQLKPVPGEGTTLASIRCRGDGSGFFRLAAPLMARMVKRSITNDLENLREYLEAQGPSS